MRLEPVRPLGKNTLAHQVWAAQIFERHRHRFEFNMDYVSRWKKFCDFDLTRWRFGRLIEIQNHPWFLACQFHPEFSQTQRAAPLFETSSRRASRTRIKHAPALISPRHKRLRRAAVPADGLGKKAATNRVARAPFSLLPASPSR